MSRLSPETVALRTLRGQQVPPRCRITREQALDFLKALSGHDFGDNADKWAAWLRVQPASSDHPDTLEREGVFRGLAPSGEWQIELDDGEDVFAILPRTRLHRVGSVFPGARVMVRLRPFGCSQVVDVLASPGRSVPSATR